MMKFRKCWKACNRKKASSLHRAKERRNGWSFAGARRSVKNYVFMQMLGFGRDDE